MASAVMSVSSATSSRVAVGSKSFTGRPVLPAAPQRTICRVNRRVEASAEQRKQAAAAAAATIATLATPLMAQATVTPSLQNLLNSLVAGGVVLGLIAAAVTAVSNFDPVTRK